MFANMELMKDALRTLLHQQFGQGQKVSAAAQKYNDLVGRDVVNKCSVQCWFNRFHEGRNSVKYKKGAGRPVTTDEGALRQQQKDRPRVSTGVVVPSVGLSRSRRRVSPRKRRNRFSLQREQLAAFSAPSPPHRRLRPPQARAPPAVTVSR
jgi:transposase